MYDAKDIIGVVKVLADQSVHNNNIEHDNESLSMYIVHDIINKVVEAQNKRVLQSFKYNDIIIYKYV